MKVHKVAVLPSILDANAIYITKVGEEYADVFITNKNNGARQVFNPELVAALMSEQAGDEVYTLTASVGGGRAVVLEGGVPRHADPTNASHANKIIGITVQAGNSGDQISIRKSGLIEDSNWNFTEGESIYLGTAGVLTTSAPTAAAFIQRIGYVASPTKVVVQITPAIITPQ